ncbi:MAG: M23 family peptidase, partial [Enterococcus hulanensis]
MEKANTAIAFPLRGEWYTETSPVDRVPSHGTDRFGLRYAFDFIQKDQQNSSHTGKAANYFLGGIPLEKYYCFGQSVFAPFAGEIVTVKNNSSDGEKAAWIHDQTTAIRHSLFFNPKKDGFEAIAG